MVAPRTAEHTLPAVHALHLASLVQGWGVRPEQLFAGLDVDADALSAPGARLPLAGFVELVGRARALTGEPALGLHAGLQMRASVYGFLGFAAMSAASVREALDLAIRFAPTVTDAIALRLEPEADGLALVLEERADLGEARDAIVLAVIVGLWQIGNAITGRSLEGRVELALPRPGYAHRLGELAPSAAARVRFGASAHRVVIARSALDAPLVMADPAALNLARAECERALAASITDAGLVARVRALLPAAVGFRSLDEVAAALRLSPRTLKRRLAERSVDFSTLRADAQRERALPLVRAGELSLAEVAARVGYSDLANFTRAFRRWTGQSPGAWRRREASLSARSR